MGSRGLSGLGSMRFSFFPSRTPIKLSASGFNALYLTRPYQGACIEPSACERHKVTRRRRGVPRCRAIAEGERTPRHELPFGIAQAIEHPDGNPAADNNID
jgi:hypothetical protein